MNSKQQKTAPECLLETRVNLVTRENAIAIHLRRRSCWFNYRKCDPDCPPVFA